MSATLAPGALVAAYRPLALGVDWLSVASFIFLGMSTTGITPLMQRVLVVDIGPAVALVIATGIAASGRLVIYR